MATQPRNGFKAVPPPKREPPIRARARDPEVGWDPKKDPITVPDEPTDEQLANTAMVLGFPIMATPMFQKMPHWRESMLNLHALMVRALNGDQEAEQRLALFQQAFRE